ncbi:HNH endonuclease [Virgibacillus sp. C22-A2]|uniref:HNH endonuclease n=1 Tax=Virgibacillus tibetensis TaxID=3042313 RepID=A0ABU6KIT5_9BACI|nr:HNH endonuclease [Virgibacillus sp. C22-A2]
MTIKPNHEMRAFEAWNLLVKQANKESTITYKELGKELDIHPRVSRYFLDYIQNYCIEQKIPPITSIVVDQKGKVGQGFIAWDADNLPEGQQLVFNFNWDHYPNPFTYAKENETSAQLTKEIITGKGSETVYSKVRVRGVAQSIFRAALLKVHGNKCAFCNFKITEALEAAHIVPWFESSDEEKLDIQNGLLLCSNHHKLYDSGVYFINTDFTIGVNGYKSKLEGKEIRLPKKKAHWPRIDYLEKRLTMSNV